MPTYQELIKANAVDLPAIKPLVKIGNQYAAPEVVSCLSAERRMGATPGRAVLRIDKTWAQTSPITLNAMRGDSGYSVGTFGSRITVSIDDTDLWRGWLVKRQDHGENDAVQWFAVEDQWLLSKVFVRGAFVWDETDQAIKYVESFTATTNPNGLWNCMCGKGKVKGVDYLAPVFAPYAKKLMNYESPEATDVGVLALGEYCAWTPRLFLLYLKFCMNVPFDSDYTQPDGVGFAGLNSAKDNQTPLAVIGKEYLQNAADIDGLVGYDPASLTSVDKGLITKGVSIDPLDRKMPTVNFQGQTMAAAMDTTLKAAGTHELVLTWPDQKTSTQIGFRPVRWSGNKEDKSDRVLNIQRAGTIASANSVSGFDTAEDITDYADLVVVDGAPVKVEARLECVVYANAVVDVANSAILPAWSDAEQYAWCQVVSGRLHPTDVQAQYAYFPLITGVYPLTSDNIQYADGGEDIAYNPDGSVRTTKLIRPAILPASPAAFNLAMQNYPTVFRAFKLNTAWLLANGVLSGVGERYKEKKRWAKLNYNRPLYAEQLQFLINNIGGSTTNQANWMRGYLPVRLSVKLGYWTELQYQNGIRTTGDGLIWMDQYTVQAASNWESILGIKQDGYDNRLDWMNAFDVILRTWAINAALPLDQRVTGVCTSKNTAGGEGFGIAPELSAALPQGIMAYFDQPEGYQEHNQVNSQPTASPQIVGIDGKKVDAKAWPLNRYVPPGSERVSAEAQATRKMRYLNAPVRSSAWRLPGINLNWAPGDYVKEVVCTGKDVKEKPYQVHSAIPRITYDFLSQTTELGGLLSDF